MQEVSRKSQRHPAVRAAAHRGFGFLPGPTISASAPRRTFGGRHQSDSDRGRRQAEAERLVSNRSEAIVDHHRLGGQGDPTVLPRHQGHGSEARELGALTVATLVPYDQSSGRTWPFGPSSWGWTAWAVAFGTRPPPMPFGPHRTSGRRIFADMSLGGYRIQVPIAEWSEPARPEEDLSQPLELGRQKRVIDSDDHPVMNQLRAASKLSRKGMTRASPPLPPLPAPSPSPRRLTRHGEVTTIQDQVQAKLSALGISRSLVLGHRI